MSQTLELQKETKSIKNTAAIIITSWKIWLPKKSIQVTTMFNMSNDNNNHVCVFLVIFLSSFTFIKKNIFRLVIVYCFM